MRIDIGFPGVHLYVHLRCPIGPVRGAWVVATPTRQKAGTDKTDKTKGASGLDLIATWGLEFGYVSLHDPTTGEWWDVKVKDAPGWAVGEARRRKAR